MKRNMIAVSFFDINNKPINDDLIELDCNLMDALNISWNQVSRVQDIILSELSDQYFEPVTMTCSVNELVSLFPTEMQSNLIDGSLAQVEISMGDCFTAAFPKSTLAVAAVENAVKQYLKKCDADLFLHQEIGAALQQMASLSTSQLVEEASFWLSQQFDENLLLESFPPGDDDRSLVSFPDSSADKEDFFYQTSDHRYPEMISTPNNVFEHRGND